MLERSKLLHVALRYETMDERNRERENIRILFRMNTVRILRCPPAVMNKILLLRLCRHTWQLREAAHPNRAKNCSETSPVKAGLG
jgi:hypothetical protein